MSTNCPAPLPANAIRRPAIGANDPATITHLLSAWRSGDQAAFAELIDQVYEVLHQIAHRLHRRERGAGQGMQTTELLNEAYFSLLDKHTIQWEDRTHFFCIAARAMKRVLIEEARRRNADKRGYGLIHLPLDDCKMAAFGEGPDGLLQLDEMLEELSGFDPLAVRVVEMRFFAGFTIEEVANYLETSISTVNRKWDFTKTWLYSRLKRNQDHGSG